MSNQTNEEKWLEDIAAEASAAREERTPSRLKSSLYSAIVRRQQESGPLASVSESKAAGRGLCVFERLVHMTPAGEKAKQFNCCSVCHARVLAERFRNAPIYWDCCPYVQFQNR